MSISEFNNNEQRKELEAYLDNEAKNILHNFNNIIECAFYFYNETGKVKKFIKSSDYDIKNGSPQKEEILHLEIANDVVNNEKKVYSNKTLMLPLKNLRIFGVMSVKSEQKITKKEQKELESISKQIAQNIKRIKSFTQMQFFSKLHEFLAMDRKKNEKKFDTVCAQISQAKNTWSDVIIRTFSRQFFHLREKGSTIDTLNKNITLKNKFIGVTYSERISQHMYYHDVDKCWYVQNINDKINDISIYDQKEKEKLKSINCNELLREEPHLKDYKYVISYPLFVDKVVFGVISIYFKFRYKLSQTDIDFLKNLSHSLSINILEAKQKTIIDELDLMLKCLLNREDEYELYRKVCIQLVKRSKYDAVFYIEKETNDTDYKIKATSVYRFHEELLHEDLNQYFIDKEIGQKVINVSNIGIEDTIINKDFTSAYVYKLEDIGKINSAILLLKVRRSVSKAAIVPTEDEENIIKMFVDFIVRDLHERDEKQKKKILQEVNRDLEKNEKLDEKIEMVWSCLSRNLDLTRLDIVISKEGYEWEKHYGNKDEKFPHTTIPFSFNYIHISFYTNKLISEYDQLIITNISDKIKETIRKYIEDKMFNKVLATNFTGTSEIEVRGELKKYIEEIFNLPFQFNSGKSKASFETIRSDKGYYSIELNSEIGSNKEFSNNNEIISPSKTEKDLLKALIQRAEARLIYVLAYYKSVEKTDSNDHRFIGASDSLKKHIKELNTIVHWDQEHILIYGESGVGKELSALFLHKKSPRSDAKFITFNCANFNENLAVDTLFGHDKGVFAGADAMKEGLLRLANGGTIFLDELQSMSPKVQAMLLRAIETKKVSRIGGTEELDADVRFICASNRTREELLQDNFRNDLLMRLSRITIKVPPLSERKDDIPLLISHFVDEFWKDYEDRLKDPECKKPLFSIELIEHLKGLKWANKNIRHLRNIVRTLIINNFSITINEKDEKKYRCSEQIDLPLYLNLFEKELSMENVIGENFSKIKMNDYEKKTLEHLVEKLGKDLTVYNQLPVKEKRNLRDQIKSSIDYKGVQRSFDKMCDILVKKITDLKK